MNPVKEEVLEVANRAVADRQAEQAAICQQAHELAATLGPIDIFFRVRDIRHRSSFDQLLFRGIHRWMLVGGWRRYAQTRVRPAVAAPATRKAPGQPNHSIMRPKSR